MAPVMASKDDGRPRPRCQALDLADSSPCLKVATAYSNLFCWYHAKQCHGMYLGYKRRNRELEVLDGRVPEYLQTARRPWSEHNFDDIQDESVVQQVLSFLVELHILLEKVIQARKLHHAHFFSVDMDYGHKKYLDHLVNRRHHVLRAIEKVEGQRQRAMYNKERWYEWVRQEQQLEEATREKESKRVKLEAALFNRHRKDIEAREKARRAKEEQRRQDDYLSEAYQQNTEALENDANAEDWDPIDDISENEREKYLGLIRHFLWIEPDEVTNEAGPEASGVATPALEVPAAEAEWEDEGDDGAKKKKKKRGKKKKAKSANVPQDSSSQPATAGGQLVQQPAGRSGNESEALGPADPDSVARFIESLHRSSRFSDAQPRAHETRIGKIKIESRDELRARLAAGITDEDVEKLKGPTLWGTIHNTFDLDLDRSPYPDDEIDRIVEEVAEVKVLLFCRLLLRHASLLPAALRAKSVEEFLSDPTLPEADLKQLCLNVEEPSLRSVRDACADFGRGDESEDDAEPEQPEPELPPSRRLANFWRYHNKHRSPLDDDVGELLDIMDHIDEMNGRGYDETAGPIRFDIAEEILAGLRKQPKTKIEVCGRSIWNYPSDSALSINGWQQFNIIAKDCRFDDAAALCRNWDEFYQLCIMTMFQFFPDPRWGARFVGDELRGQLIQLGFVPNLVLDWAEQTTSHEQQGGRNHVRRQFRTVETRNVLFAQMKRNDPVTRRFIQYMAMRPGEQLIYVRDFKTRRVVTAPPDEHLWIWRQKAGFGRSSREEYDVMLEVNSRWVDYAFEHFSLNFDFIDYYEIIIWDWAVGGPYECLYNNVVQQLRRAHRFRRPKDQFELLRPFTCNMVRESNKRIRSIKPGEQVNTVFDDLQSRDTQVLFKQKRRDSTEIISTYEEAAEETPYLFYNQSDAAEDAVLFPDDAQQNGPFQEITNPILDVGFSFMPWSAEKELDGKEDVSIEDLKAGVLLPEKCFDLYTRYRWKPPLCILTAVEWACSKSAQLPRKQQALLLDVNANAAISGVREIFDNASPLELVERNRALKWQEAFHFGDLEPGALGRYLDVMNMIHLILDGPARPPNYPDDAGSDKEACDNGPPVARPSTGQGPEMDDCDWEEMSSDEDDQFEYFLEEEVLQGHAAGLPGQKIGNKKKAKLAARAEKDRKKKEQRAGSGVKVDQRKGENESRKLAHQSTATRFKIPGVPTPADRDRERDREAEAAWNKWLAQDSTTELTAAQMKEPRWFWFLMETLSWLRLKLFTAEYSEISSEPWPHSYMMHDIMKVYVSIGLFFPALVEAEFVTRAVKQDLPERYQNIGVFNVEERARSLPKRRTPYGNKVRPREFWKEWRRVYNDPRGWFDGFPMDWAVAVRPIVAKLYRAGVISPTYCIPDPTLIPGCITAATEPHIPGGELDMFINFDNLKYHTLKYPNELVSYKDLPVLLHEARKMHRALCAVNFRQEPRFALLRLWSAPHFYPLMVGVHNRPIMSFIDSEKRGWEFNFIPKDYPESEWSIHATVMSRLEWLCGRRPELKDVVAHRGDAVIVAARDELELFRNVIAVTLALATKPWLREVDLWKSYINTDIKGIEKAAEWGWLELGG